MYLKSFLVVMLFKDLLEHPRFTRMVEEIKELGIPLVYPEHHCFITKTLKTILIMN